MVWCHRQHPPTATRHKHSNYNHSLRSVLIKNDYEYEILLLTLARIQGQSNMSRRRTSDRIDYPGWGVILRRRFAAHPMNGRSGQEPGGPLHFGPTNSESIRIMHFTACSFPDLLIFLQLLKCRSPTHGQKLPRVSRQRTEAAD